MKTFVIDAQNEMVVTDADFPTKTMSIDIGKRSVFISFKRLGIPEDGFVISHEDLDAIVNEVIARRFGLGG